MDDSECMGIDTMNTHGMVVNTIIEDSYSAIVNDTHGIIVNTHTYDSDSRRYL